MYKLLHNPRQIVSFLFLVFTSQIFATSCPEINRATHSKGNYLPSFNCFTDNYEILSNNYGKDAREQNFVRIRKNKEPWTDSIYSVLNSDTITILFYMRNSAQEGININIAKDVNIELNWKNPQNIRAKISSSNTYPKVVHDNTVLSLSDKQKLKLVYYKIDEELYKNNTLRATSFKYTYDTFLSGYSYFKRMFFYFEVVKK